MEDLNRGLILVATQGEVAPFDAVCIEDCGGRLKCFGRDRTVPEAAADACYKSIMQQIVLLTSEPADDVRDSVMRTLPKTSPKVVLVCQVDVANPRIDALLHFLAERTLRLSPGVYSHTSLHE